MNRYLWVGILWAALAAQAWADRISFKNAPVSDVIHFLAKKMGRYAEIEPGVSGMVTISLSGVTPETALRIILKSQLATYELVGKRRLLVKSALDLDDFWECHFRSHVKIVPPKREPLLP